MKDFLKYNSVRIVPTTNWKIEIRNTTMHGYLFSRIDTSISYVIGPSYNLKFGAIFYCDNYFILSVDKY